MDGSFSWNVTGYPVIRMVTHEEPRIRATAPSVATATHTTPTTTMLEQAIGITPMPIAIPEVATGVTPKPTTGAFPQCVL